MHEPGTPGATAPAKPSVILCVDDEPNILSALRRLFRAKGYKVLTAESGAAGLLALQTESVDLVISDMRMPEMDGTRFLAQVRERWPDPVRMLLTGYADVDSIIGAINQGEIHRYITKPWDDNDITLVVRHALERKALEQEKQRLEALTLSQNAELMALNASLEFKVQERTTELQQANGALVSANARLNASFITSVKVFSNLIEMRGGKLAGHSRAVADLARRIAVGLALDRTLMQDVFVAGLLCEIGKVGFADELLETPVSTMNARLLDQFRKHVVRAEQLLMPLDDLRSAALVIGAQLERWDGLGFPQRLAGVQIPVGARILALASDYDNLQIGAIVPRRLSQEEARTFIAQNGGKRYDPAIVAVFLQTVEGGGKESGGTSMGITALTARDLVEGMVLARDLVTSQGLLVLSAEHVLDQRMIRRLMDFEDSGGLPMTAHIYTN